MEVRFQPWRDWPLGLPPSIDHSTSLPEASLTISWTQLCGLVHWNSLTVPSRVTVLALSNMANEWCAEAGTAPSARAAPTAAIRAVEILILVFLPLGRPADLSLRRPG